MEIKKYPDGTSYAILPSSFDKARKQSHFTYRINSYEDLWHLGQIIDAFNYKRISPYVIIPNLIDAQADRRFGDYNQSSGLKMVCNFLNQFDASYVIFHPHNPEVVEALLDNVEIHSNADFITEILENQPEFMDEENLILMSSDAGGFKPLMKLCDTISWQGETYSASKSRAYVNGKSKLTQLVDREDFGGKDILIIDDICVYGGTFKGLSKLLRERNCGKLYLAVSHMTIQELDDDPVTNYFDKVFTTNSKYDEYTYLGNPFRSISKLEIIKLF